MLSDAAWIALFAMIPLVVASLVGSLLGPWFMARQSNAAKREEKELEAELKRKERQEDHDREDEIAERVAQATRATQAQLEALTGIAVNTQSHVNSNYLESLRLALVAFELALVALRKTKPLDNDGIKRAEAEIARLKSAIKAQEQASATAIKTTEVVTAAANTVHAERLTVGTEKIASETKRLADIETEREAKKKIEDEAAAQKGTKP